MKSFTNTTICVALAALTGAGTAGASVHIDSAGHGGRAYAEPAAAAAAKSRAVILGGSSAQGQPVIGEVSKKRRTITLNAAYTADCPSGSPAFSATKFAAAKVKKNGRYSIARTVHMRFDDGYSLVESYQARGRLTKTGAMGSLSVTDSWSKPDGTPEDTCATSQQRYRLYDSGTFAGTTDEGAPVVLQHSPGRDRVTQLLIPWTAACKAGGSMWGTAALRGAIDASGTFGGTTTQSTDLGNGQTSNETAILSGTMLPRSVLGTWSISASIVDAANTQVDACDSGIVGFKLR
jgi:hypothetical protein